MPKTASRFALFIMVAMFALVGCFAVAEPEASSGQVVAPTLAPTEVVEEAQAAVELEAAADSNEEAASSPAGPTDRSASAAEAGDSSTQALVYNIDPSQSEARFIIQEILRGADTTVVGTTSNVGGQLALDLSDPRTAQVGPIVINARDITTDNDFRNRAISNEILLTNQYELITFVPTAVVGLPESVAVGESITFQIVGDLTITDTTRQVTFDVTVTAVSPTELRGTATTEILHGDFGLTIPFSQAVSAVDNNVVLEFAFVALADGNA
jgi:polyisoprenoid-binding protein YceI